MGQKTKIDWCDSSWNPVTGCLHGCEYCYARGIARRFGAHEETGGTIHELEAPYRETERVEEHLYRVGRAVPYPFDFKPTLHRYKLDEPQKWKKPRTIFVCSMADLFGEWVPDEWIEEVFEACKAAPQHRYLFLTKNPARYIDLAARGLLPRGDNFWYGSTTVKTDSQFFYNDRLNIYMSIEPIMEPFHDLGEGCCFANWIIVGAETGNRKEKIVPKKDWIMELVEKCNAENVPLFMKESLRELMGSDFKQEFPWEVAT